MSKIIDVLIIFLMFLIAVSCKKDPPLVPPPIVQIDTTSHAINWTIDEIGEYGSILRDVVIIDENNIWAVGEIYLKDSLGNPDPKAYNAVHWDGSKWQLKRIFFPTVCGGTSLTAYPAKAIFAFNDGQIRISSSGDKIAILKDGAQINKLCLPSNVSMSINKLWGNSSNDLYVVGYGGNIAHYYNSVWSRIESGTDINLRDVWGSPDGSIVWAAGFEDSYGTVLLRKTGNVFEKVLEITDPNMPHSPGQITHVSRRNRQSIFSTTKYDRKCKRKYLVGLCESNRIAAGNKCNKRNSGQ